MPASDDTRIVDLWFHEEGRRAGLTLRAAGDDEVQDLI
jgi:hypothetical protein